MALDPVHKLHRFAHFEALLAEVQEHVCPKLVPWSFQPNVQRLFHVTPELEAQLPATKAAIDEVRALGFDAVRVCYRELAPNTCYTWHTDKDSTRSGCTYHLPIITAPGIFLAYEDGLHHLEAGTFYKIDNVRMHSYFNGAVKPRLNDVGVYVPEYTARLHLHFEDPDLNPELS